MRSVQRLVILRIWRDVGLRGGLLVARAAKPQQTVCVLHRRDSVIAWHMIPLVPVAFAVLALLAWRYDARERRAYEATLNEAEKRQLRALRRVHPAKWRAAIALKQAETVGTAAQDAAPREIRSKSAAQTGRKMPA